VEGVDYRTQAPGGHLFLEFLLKTLEALMVFVDDSDVFLEDDVLSRSGPDYLTEPPQVGWFPVCPSRIAHVVPQEKGFEAVFGGLESSDDIRAGPTPVANGLVLHGRDRARGEIPRTHQPGQLDSGAPVGFAPVARLFGNQRGGDPPAAVTFLVR
jgi:hypothetical protein